MRDLGSMTLEEAREYCLKLERDRDRAHRHTAQGAFEFSFGSLDAFTARFEDPDKIAAFSDGGRGEKAITGLSREDVIAQALARIPPRDRAFVRAVLSGHDWRDMGLPKRTFNWRIEKICKSLRFYCPPPPENPAIRLEGACGRPCGRK